MHEPGLVLHREEDVQRRALAGELERGADQAAPLGRAGGEDPAAADRRKRDGGDELGVVLNAVPLVGVGPRPVEHVLAVGMGLGEHGHRPDERTGAAQEQELRQPAAARGGATALDERRKEFVAHERLGAGKLVPFRRVDAGKGFDDFKAFHVTMISQPRENRS